jgi:hypothetical protein
MIRSPGGCGQFQLLRSWNSAMQITLFQMFAAEYTPSFLGAIFSQLPDLG